AFADIEDSIRFLVEVRYLALCARKRNGIGRDHHATILDIEADRAKIATIHAPFIANRSDLPLASRSAARASNVRYGLPSFPRQKVRTRSFARLKLQTA